MPHLKFRNVNHAFRELVRAFDPDNAQEGQPFFETDSRVGKVRQAAEPVTVTYQNPTQRVLFNQARDANPFFHLMEALWMLAGKNDVESMAYYSSKIAGIASDDGKTFNGAYGYRWRHRAHDRGGTTDQLQLIIKQLKEKPNSRRCVLQMWNVEDDLLKIDVTKDVCCNTAAYFSLRDRGEPWPAMEGSPRYVLDMTVTNRSNDLILGMLGANVVHFSILHEYMAAQIGAAVGVYNQFTNNLHVYLSSFKPDEWLDDKTHDWYTATKPCVPFPLVSDPVAFDSELDIFVKHVLAKKVAIDSFIFREPFFQHVAFPIHKAYNAYKEKKWTVAGHWLEQIKADDWRIACKTWVAVRHSRWLSQNPYAPQGVSEE